MTKKRQKIASIIIPILLGVVFIIYTYHSFTNEQMQKMKGYFINANYFYVFLSAIIAFISYVLRAYRWKYTLEYIGYVSNFKLNFIAVSIGYFLNLTIPRSGEFSRALLLTKYQNIPFDKAFGTIIAERIVDFIILLLFIFTAIAIEYNTLKSFLLLYIPYKKLIWIVALLGVFCLLGIYVLLYSKHKWVLWFRNKISGLTDGILSVFKMPNKWHFIFQTLLIWACYIFMFYMVVFAIGETKNISLGAVIVAFVIGSLTIAFTNGGFGFFPVLIANILLLYNVSFEAGNAFGWIVWISQLIITVILGALSFLLLPVVTKK